MTIRGKEREEFTPKVTLCPCSGSDKLGHPSNHIYQVVIGGFAYEVGKKPEVRSDGWYSLSEAIRMYPKAIISDSHGLCPKCEKAFSED